MHPFMLLALLAIGLLAVGVYYLLRPKRSDEQILVDLQRAKRRALGRATQIDLQIEERKRLRKEALGDAESSSEAESFDFDDDEEDA